MTDNRTNEPNKYAGFLARQNHQRDPWRGVGVKCLCGKLFDLDADHAMHQVDEILRSALVAAHGAAPQAESDDFPTPGKRLTTEFRADIVEAAARGRGEALIEAVQAHRDLHKTYGSTSVCRGGIGGQVLTAHCAEVCYNADAHEKEMDAWQKLEVEAIEFSRARAAEYRKAVR